MSVLPLRTYFVASDPQAIGVRVVHHTNCTHLPYFVDREPLGAFSTGSAALDKARVKYGNVVSCTCCLS